MCSDRWEGSSTDMSPLLTLVRSVVFNKKCPSESEISRGIYASLSWLNTESLCERVALGHPHFRALCCTQPFGAFPRLELCPTARIFEEWPLLHELYFPARVSVCPRTYGEHMCADELPAPRVQAIHKWRLQRTRDAASRHTFPRTPMDLRDMVCDRVYTWIKLVCVLFQVCAASVYDVMACWRLSEFLEFSHVFHTEDL